MTDTLEPDAPAPSSATASGSTHEVLEDATGAVAGLMDTLWAARPPSELLATIRAAEGLRSVLDAVELQVVVEVDAQNAARTEGWASTKDYLGAVTGGRVGEGRRMLALAKALAGDRAGTAAALAAGEISRAQAEAVVSVVDRLPLSQGLRSAAETLMLEEAGTRDAGELSKLGRYVLERLDPDGTERRDERALERQERAAHAGRFLSITPDGIGGVQVKGRGTVEDAAQITAVLSPLAAPRPTSDPGSCGGVPHTGDLDSPGRSESQHGGEGPIGGGGPIGNEGLSATDPTEDFGGRAKGRSCGVADCAHDGRDPREHGTRMWDALVEAARLLADTEVLPQSHGTSARIGVTIDFDALTSSLGVGTLDSGGSLSAAAVRTLACDAEILPFVLGSKSQLLDVGRTSRLVTLGLWLALIVRDRQCSFPSCTRPPIACDAHHIVHWADGGVTALHTWSCCAARTTRCCIPPDGRCSWTLRTDNRPSSRLSPWTPTDVHFAGGLLARHPCGAAPRASERSRQPSGARRTAGPIPRPGGTARGD